MFKQWVPMDTLKWFTITATSALIISFLLVILRIFFPDVVSIDIILTFIGITGAMWGGVATILARSGLYKNGGGKNDQ